MVAHTPIDAYSEVYNTYDQAFDLDGDDDEGETTTGSRRRPLTNARLICEYGFCLDGNEHDEVQVPISVVNQVAPRERHCDFRGGGRGLGSLLSRHRAEIEGMVDALEGSDLVFHRGSYFFSKTGDEIEMTERVIV